LENWKNVVNTAEVGNKESEDSITWKNVIDKLNDYDDSDIKLGKEEIQHTLAALRTTPISYLNTFASFEFKKGFLSGLLKDCLSADQITALTKIICLLAETKSQVRKEKPIEELKADFEQEYVDEHHAVGNFIAYLEHCVHYFEQNPGKIYAPYFAFVQASGSGKTRLLRQVAEEIRIVYLCARREGVNGYPERDDAGCTQLLDWNKTYGRRSDAEKNLKNRFIILIYCAQRRRLDKNLKGLKADLNSKFFKGYTDLWTDFQSIQKELMDGTKELDTLIQEISDNLIYDPKDPFPEIVLCIDEARTLVENCPVGDVSLFRIVLVVLRKVNQLFAKEQRCVIFGIFSDTSSVISNSIPSLIWDPSYRYDPYRRLKGEQLFHPYVLMRTFDCLFKKKFGWQSMGRPLTALCGKNNDLNLLYSKIVQKGDMNNLDSRDNIGACVALFIARVALYVCPQSLLARELVANHMITLTAVHSNHEDILVTTVSEPYLAAAACKAWENDEHLKQLLSAIDQQLIGGAVAEGFAGELVTQILIILAYDEVRRNIKGLPGFVPLIDFLMELCPAEYQEVKIVEKEVKNPTKGNDTKLVSQKIGKKVMLSKDLLRGSMSPELRGGRVCCLQFVSLSKDTTISVLNELLYSRACAVLKHNHKGIDLVIPVADKDKETLIGMVTISVKNAREAHEKEWIHNATAKLNPTFCFSDDSGIVENLFKKRVEGDEMIVEDKAVEDDKNLAILPLYMHVGSTQNELNILSTEFEFKERQEAYPAKTFALFGLSSNFLVGRPGLKIPLERIRDAWTHPLEFVKRSALYNIQQCKDAPLPMQHNYYIWEDSKRKPNPEVFSYWPLYADAEDTRHTQAAKNQGDESIDAQELNEHKGKGEIQISGSKGKKGNLPKSAESVAREPGKKKVKATRESNKRPKKK